MAWLHGGRRTRRPFHNRAAVHQLIQELIVIRSVRVFQCFVHIVYLLGDFADIFRSVFYFIQQFVAGAGIDILVQITDGAVFILMI